MKFLLLGGGWGVGFGETFCNEEREKKKTSASKFAGCHLSDLPSLKAHSQLVHPSPREAECSWVVSRCSVTNLCNGWGEGRYNIDA